MQQLLIRRDAVRDVHVASGRIVDDKMLEVFVRGDFNLPKPATLVRNANRARQHIRPKEPDSLDFEVDTDFLSDEFLVGDVRVEEERHLMFATPAQMRHLQQAKRWYLDGTFKVVNKPFSQLFSIHGFMRKDDKMKQVPLMFILMSKRRKQDYVAVLQKILEIMDEAPLVEGFVMDFEAGLWQAIRTTFPGLNMKGCVFHWAKAILRKVGDVGLKTTYERREGVHHLIRKLLALPFLPGQHIRRAFDRLRAKAEGNTEPMQVLFEYVEDQWMDSSLWSEKEWSIYKQAIRTNNDVEGWHRRLNYKAGRSQLQLYVLLPLLLREGKLVEIQHQLVSESALGRHRREKYVEMDWRIGELTDQYDDQEITCEQFLQKVGGVYAQQM